MGSSSSKDSAKKRMSGAALEEKRRKALEKYGILIPPAFGVTGTPSQKGTGPPISVQHRLLETAAFAPASYFDYLHHTDLATCLLRDHLTPGLWIAAQAATNTMVRVSVSPENDTTRWSNRPWNSLPLSACQLFIERKISDSSGKIGAVLQLRAETQQGSLPSLSGSLQMSKHTALFANVNTSSKGWLGGHFDRTFHINQIQERLPELPSIYPQVSEPSLQNDIYENDPFQTAAQIKPYEGLDTMSRQNVNVKFGSWLPVNWKDPSNFSSLQAAHAYAAVNMLGATAAVHGSMAFNGSLQLPVLRSYFSANLNDVDRPPLQITLERDNENETASISLSQVLAFDRWQWNPLEDRAPKVRNTVAWTVQMQSRPETGNYVEDSGAHDSSRRTNHVAMGAAWQINRGVAVKAVLHPQKQLLTTAVILKRWKHPRLACSILNSVGTNGFMFSGIGVELETGNLETNPDAYYYNYHPSSITTIIDNGNVPQTKAALPSDSKDSA